MTYQPHGKHLIAGEWITSSQTFTSQPVSGDALTVSSGGADEVDRAVKAAEAALGAANITVNKNSVPSDPQSPFVTSGIRIGTPAITTRGFGLPEMAQLATWMSDVMDSVTPEGTFDKDIANRVKAEVVALCNRFAVYDYAD